MAEAEGSISSAEKSFAGSTVAATGAVNNAITDATVNSAADQTGETLIEVLPGFPEKVSGEIVFCDADNITLTASTRAATPTGMTLRATP